MTFMVGTQGWAYSAWRGPFYPRDQSVEAMLSFYSREFNTVEINDTFYGLPPEKLIKHWKEQVPASFVFALTVPQQITHDRRFVDAGDLMARFVDRARILESRLGPLLIQLSPDFVATPENRAVFAEFLPSLDRDLRWAIEFRHASWFDEGILSLLRRRGIGLVLADGRWLRRDRLFEMARDPTARFLYLRWMGQGPSFTDFGSVQHDQAEVMSRWVDVINGVAGRFEQIYCYFNNRFEGHAPQSAKSFERMLAAHAEKSQRVASKK